MKNPTQEYLRQFYVYDEKNGVLRHMFRDRGLFKSDGQWWAFNTQYAGEEVGHSTTPAGYWYVELCGIRYRYHRVVWILVHGDVTAGLHIDHIDGNKANNRVENLRAVTALLNNRNRRMESNTLSGVPGVKLNYTIYLGDKYLGTTSDFFEAVCLRKAAELREGYLSH